jgi:hypothetical protein
VEEAKYVLSDWTFRLLWREVVTTLEQLDRDGLRTFSHLYIKRIIQGGSDMTGTHNQSRSYLNHLVLGVTFRSWHARWGGLEPRRRAEEEETVL